MKHLFRLFFCVILPGCQSVSSQDAGTAEPESDADTTIDASFPSPPEVEEVADLGLVINEIMASNDGTWVDEQGSVDDWIELYNRSQRPIRLAEFTLEGKSGSAVPLPDVELAPGAVVLLWADDEPEQGALHLPLKLKKEGETLRLRRAKDGVLADRVRWLDLPTDVSEARLPDGLGDFTRCRYATPTRLNGKTCEPKANDGFIDDVTFTEYAFPEDYLVPTSPLILSELALKPAAFIELENIGGAPLSLDDWALTITAHKPGQAFPSVLEGIFVDLPALTTLSKGERISVQVKPEHVAALVTDPEFEGVVTLFQQSGLGAEVRDRIDFNRWPSGAVLSRTLDHQRFRYCTNSTEGTPDACAPLPSRDIGERLRGLHTPGDFAALAAGGTSLGIAPVKFVIEGQGKGPVHLLSAARYPLHYTFVREVIQGGSPLDRCDPDQNALFEAGFSAFIASEYLNELNRNYLLGSLIHHVGPDLHAVEFTSGDRISAAQIKTAFFASVARAENPRDWSFRPSDAQQVTRAKEIEGQLPIAGLHAPFKGLRFQPLTAAVGYGTLTFVPTDELPFARLGSDVIVVTNDVPNDIGLVGGLITEAFQTPLSHVNLLSQARDAPNMALTGARTAKEITQLLGELVRLEVTASSYTLTRADLSEAQAFWKSRAPQGPLFKPERDLSVRGIVDLQGRGLADLPLIGAKAAQLAELGKVALEREGCRTLPITLPVKPFAVPMIHDLEHFERSGAKRRLEALRKAAAFNGDAAARALGLSEIRNLITSHPVDAALLSEIEGAIKLRYGEADVRFRSSSNAEDLEGFNGAGLYTSESGNLKGDAKSIERALRTVWASLWEQRAYDERSLAGIDHDGVAMGVLVHPRFVGELANGVAMSRNLIDPTRGDQFFINAQIGEASVANPAPGVGTEQIVYTWPPNTPELVYRSRSTIAQGRDILKEGEVRDLACTLGALHDHFARLMNLDGKNPWFTMEAEFKVVKDARQIFIKQARPFPFSSARLPADCRGAAR